MENLPQSVSKTTITDIELVQYENNIKGFLNYNSLPVEGIFSEIPQRAAVINNVNMAISDINVNNRQSAVYISKFIAAVSSGLFDAALNYLWNETVNELRKRVSQYDLTYFFDVAVESPNKKKELKNEDDLDKITDSELIHGAKEIGLISEMGYNHLDYIKYMRNWASAAHPNQSQITGLQLISWLETCIKEVISLPLSGITVEIKALLTNIRTNKLTDNDARRISLFFDKLIPEQTGNLLSGFFGMYVREDSDIKLRDNIKLISPYLWSYTNEEPRFSIGIKYGKYVANGDTDKEKFAREFLEIVDGKSYIPQKILLSEIDTAIDQLLVSHRGSDNFYSEPILARELKRLIGEDNKSILESSLREKYIYCLVECFITNGHGVAWNAESIYIDLLNQLDSTTSVIAILSITETSIKSMLQFTLCKEKYRELLNILKEKIISKPSLELVALIDNFKGPLDKIENDSTFQKMSKPLLKLIN